MVEETSQQKYYRKNRDKILKKRKEYYYANIAKHRVYYKKNAKKLNTHSRKYHAEHRETVDKNRRARYERQMDKAKAQATNYYYDNREEVLKKTSTKEHRKKSLKYKTVINANNRKKYATDPVFKAQTESRTICSKAIREGRLIRPGKCGRCGKKSEPEAHHEDYTKPLKVKWLCIPCHRFIHRKENPLKNKKKS